MAVTQLVNEREEPAYGQYGVLASDGERVQCHICGRWYISLASHVYQAHDMLADEYREQFGLNYTRGLIGEDLRDWKTRYGKWRYKTYGPAPGFEPHPPTPEMIAKMKGRPQQEEAHLTNIGTHHVTLAEQVCIICGKHEIVPLGKLRLTCSDGCRLEARRRATKKRASYLGKQAWAKIRQLPVEQQKELFERRVAKRRAPMITIPCAECGNPIPLPEYRLRGKHRTCCSPECRRKYLSRIRTGRKLKPESIAKMRAHAKERHAREGGLFGREPGSGMVDFALFVLSLKDYLTLDKIWLGIQRFGYESPMGEVKNPIASLSRRLAGDSRFINIAPRTYAAFTPRIYSLVSDTTGVVKINKRKLVLALLGKVPWELPSDEVIDNVLSTLSPRERAVIRLRFRRTPVTLEAIGHILPSKTGREIGVTRERVRQIEADALKRLRHPSRKGKLFPPMAVIASYSMEHLRRFIFAGQCPWCKDGKAHRSIASHISQAHEITGYQLREMAGLNRYTSICDPEYSQSRRESVKRRPPEVLKAQLACGHKPEVIAARDAKWRPEGREKQLKDRRRPERIAIFTHAMKKV